MSSKEAKVKGGLTFTSGAPRSDPVSKKILSVNRTINAEPGHGGGGGAWRDPTVYTRKAAVEAKLGRSLTLEEFRRPEHWVPPPADNFSRDGRTMRAAADGTRSYGTQEWVQGKIEDGDIDSGLAAGQSGTSTFDPVLTEMAYRWFCPPGGLVLDPFAGGSVRGIVAAWLGRRYLGIDLSERQLAANREQAEAICAGKPIKPEWRCGDARDTATIAADIEADFILSCPPYWNLERYSDDERDLSTLNDFDRFYAAYADIIAGACGRLKNDRFACFVVGDVRDAKGFYCGLPGATTAAFEAAGLRLYNDAILVTAAGSLPVRVRGQFEGSRKLGKTHQNILVFCKGDPKAATAAIGPVEFGDIEALAEAPLPSAAPDAIEQMIGPARTKTARADIGGEV